MGFLSKLFGKAKRAAANMTGGKKHDVKETRPVSQPQSQNKPAQSQNKSKTTGEKRVSQVVIPANVKAYFDEILASEFSGYEIRENVSAGEINSAAESWFRPYTYVLYNGGQAHAAIMLTPANRHATQAFAGSKEVCKNAGVQFINFFTHYPNEREYVINRIKGFGV